ncbi:MAG: tRNA (N(6)-L-threonylcarbamoyladenosine(37)-C(2))-methylthiotransferase MtaB [Firmicutes bacterium]|nr:tRNA (N(6)-L-threonylcarbamoyladenosine(37)-C(2))-methylthiotransferase MtaB [Candidatus Caballimonas caccae]
MKVVVFTLGCKVNECESDSLISGLIDMGYEVSDKLEYADLYIVNTCAVTLEAEKKSRQMSARIKKLNSKAKIIFTGCACQNNPKAFIEKENTSLVTGVFSKNKILEMLFDEGERIAPEEKVFNELLPVKSLRTRTYVKIEDGCNNFCSYCLIPYLRGRERSRDVDAIIKEIELVKPKEAVLNGINISAYNFNGITLSGLIEKLKGVKTRIRLGSLEVNVIDEKLLTALKNLNNFAEQFHLSLQSGSDNVLKKMNRHYNTQEYLEKVNLIRKYFPNAGITTDIIEGFPTETEEDFIATMNFIDKVEFSEIHPFMFSARKGTVAYKMKELPYEVKKERLDKLIEKKHIRKEAFLDKQIGLELEVLFEEYIDGYSVGYSGNYVRVYTKENLCGKMKIVKITSKYLDGLLGE